MELGLAKLAKAELQEAKSAPQSWVYKELSREEALKGVSKKEDKKGWYVYTHRARSKSYPSIDAIPTGVIQHIEKTGSEEGLGLVKLALDAMKAREMARSLGVSPEPGSAWKWALRNLRDSRGNPLEGQALGEAKLGLGKTPNNMRQKMESVIRRVGGDKEVGTVVRRNDPEWNDALVHGKMNRSELSDYDITRRLEDTDAITTSPDPMQAFADMMGKPFKQYRIGTTTNGVTGSNADTLTPNTIERTIHSHPYNPGLANRITHMHMDTGPVSLDDFPDEDSLAEANSVVGNWYNRLAEAKRMGTQEAFLVSPSGYKARITPKDLEIVYKKHRELGFPVPDEITPQMLMSAQPDGDYKAWLQKEQFNPGLTHNIIDPMFGHEGVHKLRPHGLRSVYFKRQEG